MVVAVAAFGANFAVSRFATQHGLTAFDLTLLRFGVAGPLLLPFFVRRLGRTCGTIGWKRGILLAASSGAPVTVLASLGAAYAPAAHGAALGPGTTMLVGVGYAIVASGIWPNRLTIAGIAAIVAGLAVMAIAGTTAGSPLTVLGDLFYFGSGLLWGFFPVLVHRWRLGGIEAASICAVLSLAYVPIHLALFGLRFLDAPIGVTLFMAVYLGVINSIVAMWLWGQGVRTLGPAATQFFPPLIPVVGVATAIPVLGEWPGPLQLLAVAAIVLGLVLASRGSRRQEGVRV